ncbi:excinuclease ABC subunit C [Gammaproteobacteria bacterium 42_54_T18]|nr:excinuclease ABC subunit C [Gammaproteobacteria bacterium 42_54_T18]
MEDSLFNIPSFLKSLTQHPGVYRMLGDDDVLLYVGKAKNLKKRVSSYFRKNVDSPKTKALVEKIRKIEVTVTLSETEALLLEHTLIKKHKPPYNILLRDDKSYPYIYLSMGEYPRLSYHRGAKKAKGRYFGPYPSAGAVRESMALLQKLFKLRQCDESFYRNRSRACLQYQIGRCKGPCVGHVNAEEYNVDVKHTVLFLEGKDSQVADEITGQMELASGAMEFEQAAFFRDQIIAIRHVQEQQFVTQQEGDVDIFGVAVSGTIACVHVVFVRAGRVIGSKNYFPKTMGELDVSLILEGFLPQYYLGTRNGRDLPKEIIVPERVLAFDVLESALLESDGRKVEIKAAVRSIKAGWIRIAQANAEQNLLSHVANKENIRQRFISLQELLCVDELPQRLECFDISHTQGESTVASCVVFNQSGPVKSDYRRFNIEGITPGDDYAAMKQVLERRYTRLKKGEGKLPDILVVDGGKGQLTQAREVLQSLQIQGVMLLGVAKGTTRKAGLETLFLEGDSLGFSPKADDPGLHLIQHIRDESHRVAIAGHRQKRAKTGRVSPLEGIDGVGPKRRRDLLLHFGGFQEIARASQGELTKVKGISAKMATDIYAALHSD